MATSATGGMAPLAAPDAAGLADSHRVLQQGIQNGRPPLAKLPPRRAGAMQQLQPVRFHLEKVLVARELFRRGGVGRERQPRRGDGFDFFEQVLHECIGWPDRTVKAKKIPGENLRGWGKTGGYLLSRKLYNHYHRPCSV